MRNIILAVLLIFALLTIPEKDSWGQLYKWVDEKGTVHFSDNPVPAKSEDGKPAKDRTKESLKGLEIGNRQIPDDIKKYGPAGGNVVRPRDDSSGSSSGGKTPTRTYRT